MKKVVIYVEKRNFFLPVTQKNYICLKLYYNS